MRPHFLRAAVVIGEMWPTFLCPVSSRFLVTKKRPVLFHESICPQHNTVPCGQRNWFRPADASMNRWVYCREGYFPLVAALNKV